MDMDIGDLLNNLSEEDISSLQEAAKSIFGASGASAGEGDKAKEPSDGEMPDFASMLNNPEMIMKLSRVMSMFNKKDSRSDFITALKPYLSDGRKKRADEAMQFIKLMELLPELQKQMGKDGGKFGLF